MTPDPHARAIEYIALRGLTRETCYLLKIRRGFVVVCTYADGQELVWNDDLADGVWPEVWRELIDAGVEIRGVEQLRPR